MGLAMVAMELCAVHRRWLIVAAGRCNADTHCETRGSGT